MLLLLTAQNDLACSLRLCIGDMYIVQEMYLPTLLLLRFLELHYSRNAKETHHGVLSLDNLDGSMLT